MQLVLHLHTNAIYWQVLIVQESARNVTKVKYGVQCQNCQFQLNFFKQCHAVLKSIEIN